METASRGRNDKDMRTNSKCYITAKDLKLGVSFF